MEITTKQCTCEGSEYDAGDKWDRHTPECALSPDTTGWLWYPHDGEIEDGGVWVNPEDRSKIYLEVKGYVAPAFLNEDEFSDEEE